MINMPKKIELKEDKIKQLFEEYKNDKTLLADIAQDVDCSTRTVYRLFLKSFGSDYTRISRKKMAWSIILTDEQIKQIFLEYKKGIPSSQLAEKYQISRGALITRFRKVVGQEYTKLAKTRRIDDGAKSRRKVSEKKIRKTFEAYKKSRISTDDLATKLGIAESSLIFRFKRLFGEEYRKVAISRRDERKVTKEVYIKAFEKYKNTNVSIVQLAEQLGVRISSLAPRFRRLFGKEYSDIAERKMDLIEIDKKGKVGEKLVLEYLKLMGHKPIDVRRKKILTGSLKTPDFLIGNKFVEVKTYYLTLNGFGNLKGYKQILDSYLGKETIDGKLLDSGMIVSFCGFSPQIRDLAKQNKIDLIGHRELGKIFKINNREDLLEELKNICG